MNQTGYSGSTDDFSEITRKDQLVNYIRLMLGEPLIQVELQDAHIIPIIQDTVKTYTDVVYGFFENAELIEIDPYNHRIRLRTWNEIHKVCSLDGKTDYTFKWDSIKRVLELQDDRIPLYYPHNECAQYAHHAHHAHITTKPRVMVVGETRYRVDEEFDLIYNETWVKEFAKAKTQLLWGQVLGKYSQNLVGGATINYDRLISEAQSEIDRLMEELHEKWMDPAPVLVE